MKTILIIGIGAGNPEYVTMQAVRALNRADVFFIMDKGPEKAKLVALRKDICDRYISDQNYRVVDAASPDWSSKAADYRGAVDGLNREKRALFERLFREELQDGECGAFLVWGDPALYDSTIRIVSEIVADSRTPIDFEVIPGISSIQALTARHRTTLNRIGKPVEITTGRLLGSGFPEAADSLVVMLDSRDAYTGLEGQDLDIFWGAYIGTPDEILISGRLSEVAEEIRRVRAEARARHGWIMDSYLLRRRGRD